MEATYAALHILSSSLQFYHYQDQTLVTTCIYEQVDSFLQFPNVCGATLSAVGFSMNLE